MILFRYARDFPWRFQIPRFIPHTKPTQLDQSDRIWQRSQTFSDDSDVTGPYRPNASTS